MLGSVAPEFAVFLEFGHGDIKRVPAAVAVEVGKESLGGILSEYDGCILVGRAEALILQLQVESKGRIEPRSPYRFLR